MNAVFALMRKDLRLFFSNRRSLVVSIVAPILIAAFFGGLSAAEDSTPSKVAVGVVDEDRTRLSRQVVVALKADPNLEVTEGPDANAAASAADSNSRASIKLPRGFGAQIGLALFGNSAKPQIELRWDPSQPMILPLIRGALTASVMRAVFDGGGAAMSAAHGQAAVDNTLADHRKRDLAAMFDAIAKVQGSRPAAPAASAGNAGVDQGQPGMPFTTRETQMSTGAAMHYSGYGHAFAGMGVQFILFMGVDMAIGLLLMRRLGLWTRLRAAPLSRRALLGSRIASTAVIALIIFGIIYTTAISVFGVRVEGSVVGFAVVLMAFALLTASFGLLIAALGRTPEATRGLATVATLLLVMLGGAWVPSFVFPSWLQTVSLAAPTRWAIDGLDAMTWRGQPLEAAVLPVAVMLGFTALFSVVAVWRFRWEE
jgi:ABC-2 type transport system permease protein